MVKKTHPQVARLKRTAWECHPAACNKRPVSTKKIESLADEIEARLQELSKSEVTSKFIGELVMEKLKSTDEIAYVRFASVYRKFQDKTEFFEELKKLLG